MHDHSQNEFSERTQLHPHIHGRLIDHFTFLGTKTRSKMNSQKVHNCIQIHLVLLFVLFDRIYGTDNGGYQKSNSHNQTYYFPRTFPVRIYLMFQSIQ